MTGRQPGLYWRLSWRVISPLLLLGVLVAYVALLLQSPPTYWAWNPDYVGTLLSPRGPHAGRGAGLVVAWGWQRHGQQGAVWKGGCAQLPPSLAWM